MQEKNTSNSLLNCKTTLMCTTANSLWLNNLPFSQTFQRGGWKLCTDYSESGMMCNRGGGRKQRVSGIRHFALTTQDGEKEVKGLKCINFSAPDRMMCDFSGWAKKAEHLDHHQRAILQKFLLNSSCAFTLPVHYTSVWSGRFTAKWLIVLHFFLIFNL